MRFDGAGAIAPPLSFWTHQQPILGLGLLAPAS
jgi:hypothetical protein